MSEYKIINTNFSNTNPWYKNKKDITVTVDLLLPAGSKVSMSARIESSDGSTDVTLDATEYEFKTKIVYIIPYSKLNIGDNKVTLNFSFKNKDEEEETITETETIKVETRDDFELSRNIKYSGEYITSGQLKLDASNNLHINGSGQGFAVPRNYINMDGKHSIKSVNVTASSDSNVDINITQEPLHYEDKDEYAVYKVPLKKIANYYAINSISLMAKE